MRTHISKLASEKELQALSQDTRLKKLQALLNTAELYPVGGTVRDCLLKKKVQDLDLASSISAEEALKILEKNGVRVIATGLQHQTITALPFANLGAVEITSFRAGRILGKEDAALHSIEQDLAYRDFTINALALDPNSLEVIDETSGLEDLDLKTIRAVGEAESRFKEDPLRILRMLRFACALAFEIEEQSLLAAKNLAHSLESVSIERIRDEFSKMLLSKEPDRAIRLLLELDLLKQILPEILPSVGFEQNKYHLEDVFEHSLSVLKRTSAKLELRLAALLHDIAKPDTLSVDEHGERHFFQHERVGAKLTKDIMRRLKFSNLISEQVSTLVYTHMRPIEAGPGGLRRLLRDTEELFPIWRELKEADAGACKIDADTLKERLEKFDAAIEEVKKGPAVSPLKNLALNGTDLIALGLSPSKKFKEILHELHEMVLDRPELNEKEGLIEIVKARFL